jgi:uncharacterized membrane protein
MDGRGIGHHHGFAVFICLAVSFNFIWQIINEKTSLVCGVFFIFYCFVSLNFFIALKAASLVVLTSQSQSQSRGASSQA